MSPSALRRQIKLKNIFAFFFFITFIITKNVSEPDKIKCMWQVIQAFGEKTFILLPKSF